MAYEYTISTIREARDSGHEDLFPDDGQAWARHAEHLTVESKAGWELVSAHPTVCEVPTAGRAPRLERELVVIWKRPRSA